MVFDFVTSGWREMAERLYNIHVHVYVYYNIKEKLMDLLAVNDVVGSVHAISNIIIF